MKDHESEEMYLETILVLRSQKPAVRSIDIAEKLGYAKSSVSRGVNLLTDKGLIEIDGDGFICFTAAGEKKARDIYDRHRTLTGLLDCPGLAASTARKRAGFAAAVRMRPSQRSSRRSRSKSRAWARYRRCSSAGVPCAARTVKTRN